MKKALSLVFAIAVLLSLALPAAATGWEIPYVTDEVGVLSRNTVSTVNEANDRLYDKYGTYLVVVFIDYFGAMDPAEYTVSLFNEWGISSDAALLVAAVGEGIGGISLGANIDNRANEKDMADLLDKYFWPDFDKGNYDKAVTKLMSAMETWFTRKFGGSSSGSSSGSTAAWLAGLGIMGVILGFVFRNFIVILVLVLIIALVIRSDRRRYRGYYVSMGMPIPRYYPWYVFQTRHPYHRYRPPAPPRPTQPSRPSGTFRPTNGHSSSFSGRTSRPSRPSSPRPPSSRPSSSCPSSSRGGGSFRGGSGRSGGGFSGRR